MSLHVGGPCSTVGQGIFSFTVFCFVLFKPLFLRIGLFPFIHTASPLQLHKVLLGDLYSSLHL